MTKRRTVLGAAAALATGLGGCVLQGPRYRYRYKLTLQALVDGAVHTGVNVVQVEWRLPAGPSEWRWPGDMAGAVVKGEANVVDLGGGRLLVALLTKRIPDPSDAGKMERRNNGWGELSPEAVLARAYGLTDIKAGPGDDRAGTSPFLEALIRQRGSRKIGVRDLPTLVTFRDPHDPLTVEQIAPLEPKIFLDSRTIGIRTAIEITDDPATKVIVGCLPWLTNVSGYLNGEPIHHVQNATLPNTLDVSDFVRPSPKT